MSSNPRAILESVESHFRRSRRERQWVELLDTPIEELTSPTNGPDHAICEHLWTMTRGVLDGHEEAYALLHRALEAQVLKPGYLYELVKFVLLRTCRADAPIDRRIRVAALLGDWVAARFGPLSGTPASALAAMTREQRAEVLEIERHRQYGIESALGLLASSMPEPTEDQDAVINAFCERAGFVVAQPA
jgi:hypothetical protein